AFHELALRRADLGDARGVQQPAPDLGFELTPQRINVAQQAHVRGMLEIAEADDAGRSVRGTAVVSRLIPLDAEHTNAPDREAVQRRAAHHSKPDHDHVEARHLVPRSPKASTLL